MLLATYPVYTCLLLLACTLESKHEDVRATICVCLCAYRYLYEIFITGPGAPGGRTPASLLCAEDRARELRDTVAVLQALALLLDSETRLLGLLASKSAVAPFVKALQVGLFGLMRTYKHMTRTRSNERTGASRRLASWATDGS